MNTGFDTLADFSNWRKLFELMPSDKQCPYFSPMYYLAYQAVDGYPASCFWAYKDNDNFLFYPFIKRSINDLGYDLDSEYYDISGAYGYNGPTGIATDEKFVRMFNEGILSWLRDERVVSELVRYCPITGNRRFHTYTEQIDVLDNVYVDLTPGLDKLWKESFSYGVRKAVRKGQQYGLKTVVKNGYEITEADIHVFSNIYHSTMQRNEADSFYYFPEEFFRELINRLGETALLVLTWLDENPISAEMVLLAGSNAYGFLGGTIRNYYKYKANTFQRWELLKHLFGIGVKSYSMGGGATRGDSIYKYKASFSRDCENPFYIGTKIYRPDIYEQIVSQWKDRFPACFENFSYRLQGYRIQA